MKPLTLIGVILIIIGVAALAFQGFSYTTKEKVLDVGPITVHAEKERTVPLPPVLGGLALAAGVVLVIAGSRRS